MLTETDSLMIPSGKTDPLTPVGESSPPQTSWFSPCFSPWFGRCIHQLSCSTIVKKTTATCAAVGAGVLAYMGVQSYLTAGYSLTASLATGVGIGFCIPIAIGMGLCTDKGKEALDFLAKWSFAGMDVATQFVLNAGFPMSGIGLWNTAAVPAAVVFGSNMFFGAMATCYLTLHLRSILLKRAEPEPDPFAMVEKNRLLLECGTDQSKKFALEQLLKAGIASGIIALEQLGVLTAPEWRLGLFLFGGVAGSTGAFLFYRLKDRIEQKYPSNITIFSIHVPWQTQLIRTVEKIGFFAAAPLMGILCPIPSPYTLIGFGALYSIQKFTNLRRFENLQQNPQTLTDINWKSVETVAQGILMALGCTWFIYGMTDPSNTTQDRINITVLLASTLVSYPLTRVLIQKWDPQQRSTFLNTIRFYVVDNPSLYLPFFIRRLSGALGDSTQPNSIIKTIVDIIAWASFGATWGSFTAYNGALTTTKYSSPVELSPVTVISSAKTLVSGTLGGV